VEVFKITIDGKPYEIMAKASGVVAMEGAVDIPLHSIPQVFIIGKYSDRARIVAAILRANGHKVTADLEEKIIEQLVDDLDNEREDGLSRQMVDFIQNGYFKHLSEISRKKREAAEAAAVTS